MTAAETMVPKEFRERPYRVRRARNWLLVGFMYSLFYMSRYNFTAVAPTLQHLFGWTNADLGIFETLGPLVYGLSVVLNGPLADRFGGRRAFLFGAAGVVVMNLAFGAFAAVLVTPAGYADDGETLVTAAQLAGGLSAHGLAWIMAIVWSLNFYFQSFGALSIVKINAQWFHLRERGTFAAIFGILIRFGLILAFSGTPLIVAYLPWQWAFWIPAGFVFLLFLGNLFFVSETPEDAGFAARDTGDASSSATGERPSVLVILRKVFASRVMWMIAVGSMMIGMVRRSVLDAWWPVYLKETYHLDMTSAPAQLTSWGIAIFGIIGGFTLGILSDRLFDGRRAPVIVFGFVGMTAALLLFMGVDALAFGAYGATASLMVLSFFVNGAHGMIGGAASMDFGGREAAATAAGLFDGMQYLAAALCGTAVGYISQDFGWQAWKLWALPFAIIGAVVMSFLWNEKPKGGGGGH